MYNESFAPSCSAEAVEVEKVLLDIQTLIAGRSRRYKVTKSGAASVSRYPNT